MTVAQQPPRFLSCRVALALAAGMTVQRAAAEPVADSQLAAQSGAALGVDLYHSLSQKGGNMVYSPYSISEMIALLSAGAGGKTRDELLQALQWVQPAGRLPGAFKEQDDLLDRASGSGAVLQVANGLWFQNGGAPRQAFLDLARDDFRAEARGVDFATGAPAVRLEINAWVGQKTSGKISDLVPEGA